MLANVAKINKPSIVKNIFFICFPLSLFKKYYISIIPYQVQTIYIINILFQNLLNNITLMFYHKINIVTKN